MWVRIWPSSDSPAIYLSFEVEVWTVLLYVRRCWIDIEPCDFGDTLSTGIYLRVYELVSTASRNAYAPLPTHVPTRQFDCSIH